MTKITRNMWFEKIKTKFHCNPIHIANFQGALSWFHSFWRIIWKIASVLPLLLAKDSHTGSFWWTWLNCSFSPSPTHKSPTHRFGCLCSLYMPIANYLCFAAGYVITSSQLWQWWEVISDQEDMLFDHNWSIVHWYLTSWTFT